MTVLGAVVFGGILALAVLWLLVTAPGATSIRRGANRSGPSMLEARSARPQRGPDFCPR